MRRALIVGLVGGVVLLGVVFFVPRVSFITGGALVDLGYRLQDPHEDYDFEHAEDITPTQIWDEFSKQNQLASGVREVFPRTVRHPLVAMLVCMDARLDTNEITGDTRRDYYVLRTAGSVMAPEEEEMLELGVRNGVKLVLLTRHTDCAAEKAAKDPESARCSRTSRRRSTSGPRA
ncbi:MAG: carbonic anhydrase [Myxococcaceae bacterium]